VGAASPGPLGYGCIALGFLADGWRGAIVATLTSWLPAFLAIPLRRGYRQLEGRPWIGGVTWGVAAAGTGLLVALSIGLFSRSVTSWRHTILAVGLLLLLARKLPTVAVLVVAAAAGAFFLH
jgi:chromate transporter